MQAAKRFRPTAVVAAAAADSDQDSELG